MDDFKQLSEKLSELTQHGVSGMSPSEVKEHRNKIIALNKQCKEALAQTSLKEHNYDDSLVMNYIFKVLSAGYNLEETKLSQDKSLADAQKLTRWKALIKACVQNSEFSYANFKIKELLYQRNAIEHSRTLHELRQNVKAIIGPLKMHREYNKPEQTIEYEISTEDKLLIEVEQLKAVVVEQRRVIDAITDVYNDGVMKGLDVVRKVKAIDAFKQEHNCSDEQACKVFNISRMTLSRYRKDMENAVDRESPIDDSVKEAGIIAPMLQKPVTLNAVAISPQVSSVFDSLEDSVLWEGNNVVK